LGVEAINPRRLAWLGALGLGLCTTAAAVALDNTVAPHRGASAAIAAVTLASLFGVGLYAWYRGPERRFGRLLVLAGFVWFLASLSSSDAEFLYSVGRTSAWAFEVVLIYTLLAYPTGHLPGRAARIAFSTAAFLVLALYLPTVPLLRDFQVPSVYSTCTAHCPPNWFFIAGSEPGVIDTVVKPVRDLLTLAVYLSVTVILAARLRAASPILRLSFAPVLGAATLRFGAAFAYVGLRAAGVGNDVLDYFALLALLTVPLTATGFLIGLLEWRLYSGRALIRLSSGQDEAEDPRRLRSMIAEVLDDPSLELFYSTSGIERRWHDAAGEPCALPRAASSRYVVELSGESGIAVAIACDGGFRDQPAFLRAVAFCALSALERQRLTAALNASLRDVEASRKRLAAAADTARQKIERDLHDGAQQQLVTLRVKLELATETLREDPKHAAELLAQLGAEVQEIIDEVRSLARGIYPPLLASGGLTEALDAAVRRAPLPVSLEPDGVGRYSAEIESAVYFCCLEALQNATKHAAGASRVWIRLSEEGELHFEVRDDGSGLSRNGNGPGSGIIGMRDRMAAVGGELRIESDRRSGTRVVGVVPLA
jgi:signal transduction histidine kinase